jgi:hypothetical protein
MTTIPFFLLVVLVLIVFSVMAVSFVPHDARKWRSRRLIYLDHLVFSGDRGTRARTSQAAAPAVVRTPDWLPMVATARPWSRMRA